MVCISVKVQAHYVKVLIFLLLPVINMMYDIKNHDGG